MLSVEATRDPFVPRPGDLPTAVPLDGTLEGLDNAKIFAAPDNPAEWPAWRAALARWREQACAGYDGSAYERLLWTQRCFSVALVWLWDELLYDHAGQQFTPERLLDEAEREFGGYDGVVLWQAYPVIGIDERNQFDFYREAPGLGELVTFLRERGVRVFIAYNPWDIGTRRPRDDDATALAEIVRELGADGVFLDTMKEARPELLAALPDVSFEAESTLPLDRISDHHLSWAQWFADSSVPGVIRARWFEQRHMLHHTRRWNRDHSEELRSAWLNGVGILVWENVFGSWVGWNERDRATLRGMVAVQRRYADLLTHGEWTPLAARSDDLQVVGSCWRRDGEELWALANRADEAFDGEVVFGARARRMSLGPLGLASVTTEGVSVFGGGSAAFPARSVVRVPAPTAVAAAVPAGMVAVEPRPLVARFRRRETGVYGQVPYVEEWKPLPPRLHDFVQFARPQPRGRFAIGVREVTGAGGAPLTDLSLAEAREYAAAEGARLPTEDEWQLAAEHGLLERVEPLVWNWTESEHSDGRTRFAILKGGAAFRAEGSDWYVDGGPQAPDYSLELLLAGPLQRSSQIGFRMAVDL